MAKEYWIHPAIGIARLGNSNKWFLGPEIPGETPNAGKTYKDQESPARVKKQGQRFRIYEYDTSGPVPKPVREIKKTDARITWHVHLVNKKAALREQLPPAAPRNPDLDPDSLTIDAGKVDLAGNMQKIKGTNLVGNFLDTPVQIGRIIPDQDGRLIVLAGNGHSEGSSTNSSLNFANNDGWFDDTADGIISATVQFRNWESHKTAKNARVICAPPDFAPAIQSPITMYDLALQAAIELDPALWPDEQVPVFATDVLPVLQRLHDLCWVDEDAWKAHGPDGNDNFLQQLHLLSDNTTDPSSPAFQLRRSIFFRLRRPSACPIEERRPDDPPAGRKNIPQLPDEVTLTPHQYGIFRKWSLGEFSNGHTTSSAPSSFADLPLAAQVVALDRASLDTATGASLALGSESWGIMAKTKIYAGPFRVTDEIPPGSLTMGNALPWQTGFYACGAGWWPSHRPGRVLRREAGKLVSTNWVRDIDDSRDMVQNWATLGFIVPDGQEQIETEQG